MFRRYILSIISLILALVISSCSSSPDEISTTPTNTPKPRVECPEEEVETYLDEIDLIFEEWDDTKLRAESTSRMSLSPVIGELQDIKRNTRRIERPECANYLNDVIIVAMERDIDSFISFLSQDNDSVVARKMEGAEKAWEIVNEELDKFSESPREAYQSTTLSAQELEKTLDEDVKFERPEDWIDKEIPNTNLVFSIPDDWSVTSYGEKDQFLETTNPDETLTLLIGSSEESGFANLDSDAGRLFALQTLLETTDYDYYLEKNSDIEIHSRNKAYVVEFSVRENPWDGLKEDRVWAVVITPEENEVLVIAETTRNQFAKIDLIIYRSILGSIR